MRNVLFAGCALAMALPAHAGHLHPEAFYQDAWCSAMGGDAEVRLADGTRADCLMDGHAVEVDFGPKWAEAIGQALYYAMQTGKRAGVLLILEEPGDRKYWLRLNSTIMHYGLPIDSWEIGAP